MSRVPPLALALVASAALACHEIHFDPDRQSASIDIYDDLWSEDRYNAVNDLAVRIAELAAAIVD